MNTSVAATRLIKLFLSLSCFCFILPLNTVAFAVSKNDILQPLKNNLIVYKNAQKELNRQVKNRFSVFDTEQKVLEKSLVVLDTEAQCAREESMALEDGVNLAVLTGWQLIKELDDRIYIPGYGRVTMDELLEIRDTHRNTKKTMDSEIDSGTKEFFVAGLGMINKNTLEKHITAINEKRAALKKKVKDGSIRIYFSGLGFVTKKELDTAITAQKAKIAAVTQQIAAGDYIVSIPGLGDVSKNQLKAEILALQEQIKALRQSFKTGDVRINRLSEGWFTEQNLTEKDKQLKTDSGELKSSIKNNEYKHLLPIGWVTLKDLDARINQLKKEKEAIEKQVAKKQYRIALTDGTWATEKDIDKALMNSLLSLDIKNSLETGKKSIILASQYEIKQKEMELAKLKKWKTEFKNHIQPLTEYYAQQLKKNAALRNEFSMEQRSALAPLQQKLSFLQKSLKQIP